MVGWTLSCSGLQCCKRHLGHVELGDSHVISVAVLSIHGVVRCHRCQNICTRRSSCRQLATVPEGQSRSVMSPDHLSYHLPHAGVARKQHRVVANECQRDTTLTK